jgi:superfamily II DNA/RNA helicase
VERALNLARLTSALGEHADLPSPSELQSLMADAEVGLFIQRPEIPSSLLQTAWYLHGIASTSAARELYSPDRRRRAFQVSAHLFDLALADIRRSRVERLRLAFAAQVGYRRTGLEPNAMAMFARLRSQINADVPLMDHVDTVALEAGVALLGFDSRYLFPFLRDLRQQFGALRRRVDVASLQDTLFGPAWAVVEGAHLLLRYLALGETRNRERATSLLGLAIESEGAVSDLDARWVAAHLASFAGNADTTSVWSVLPATLPAAAKRALTLTAPPVLSLWRPQMELVTEGAGPNPLTGDARRVVLSVPTSAGKTLMAQMIMVSHLATGLSSVCFVAPMRSLGREVRAAMRGRMAVLRRELGRDFPDFADFGLEQADLDNVGVDVMTPERLMHLVRRDHETVLQKYSLFIFDEAHMLADRGRGPLLENLLAFLHWRTAETTHRLVLLSAAIGNRGEVMGWFDPTGEGVPYSSDWRGPRRLHAIYTTEKARTPSRTKSVRSEYSVRKVFDLTGIIRLRPAEEARIARLAFVEPVGELATRETAEGRRHPDRRESSHSTPGYRTSAHVAAAVGHAGPVLVVMSSRVMARQMARAIAELTERRPGTRQLTDLARDRLGDDHPLVEVIPRGVAFHHGGLPADILEALEDALRDGIVGWMVATSTLTEGVNLPVRTVVIAETRYDGQPVDAQLRGARLVNAMGRAGRATKESEGWIVLCRQAREAESDFDLLKPGDDQLEVHSRLATEEALEQLAQFEEAMRAREDAIFERAGEDVRSFLAYVWFVLAAEEERGRVGDDANLDAALMSTLGFAQVDTFTRGRWQAVAERVRRTYETTEPARRRRWSRAGTSVASARYLDSLAASLADLVVGTHEDVELGLPIPALELLDEAKVLVPILALPEAPRPWKFRTHASATATIDVDPVDALSVWVQGVEIAAMAQRFLSEVAAPDLRIEQMVDAVTEHFEHYLSWILGVLIDLTNAELDARGIVRVLCPDLSLYVRYGVRDSSGIALAIGGVRSRRLIHEIARQAVDDGAMDHLEGWLSAMSIEVWRTRFAASGPELLDLLEFTRTKHGAVLPDFLETGRTDLDVDLLADAEGEQHVTVAPVPDDPPPPRLGVTDDHGALVAVVPPCSHPAVEAVIATGLAFNSVLDGRRLALIQSE